MCLAHYKHYIHYVSLLLTYYHTTTELSDQNLSLRMALKNKTIKNNEQNDFKKFYWEDKPELKDSLG